MIEEALYFINKEIRDKTGSLELSWMYLTEVPKELSEMVWLQELNLIGNSIEEIEGLELLTNLKSLYLRENQIKKINGLETLINLQKLELNKNQIREITGLETLTNLKELYLLDNYISELKGLETLINLEHLSLPGNQISEIIGLESLTNLQALSLEYNEVEKITGLRTLTNLQTLYLQHNKLKEIPESQVLLENLKYIGIEDNPIENPPYAICLGGIDAIRSWYLSAGKIYQDTEGHWHLVGDQKLSVDMIPLHEIKMVMIGNGNVGKTSLALRLKDRKASLPTPQERTHGLATYRWEKNIHIPLGSESQTFRFNIWDFGGQGKFRAVQQLFCSRKSLYLYVTSPDDKAINSLEEYQDCGYWLAMIRAYSFDPEASQASPVIHVSNKLDLGAVPVNESDMLKVYPELHPVTVRASALTNEGLDTLEKTIETVLPKVSFDVFTSTYSPQWLDLKKALEERSEAYLSLVEYEHLAGEHNLSKLETEQWLWVLHRLGTVIYFNAIPELRDTIFLKPEWVREAAYGILRSKVIEENYGQFRERDFILIWPNYTAEEHQKLIALMQTFELCYVTRDDYGRNLYITPALFPEKSPMNYSFNELSLKQYFVFELRFLLEPFLPAGLLHRLIVRLHTWLYRSYSWRKGAVLHYKETYAEIAEDWENNHLSVKLKGPAPQDFFNSLRKEVEQIIANLKNTQMLNYLEVSSEVLYKEEWWELDKLEKLPINFWQQKVPPTGISLFISYAHEDEAYKDELIKHLSGLRQNGIITDWNDRQILPGQEWDWEIKEKLENSQIVLFLVSPDFIHSDYINDVEIARSIDRNNRHLVNIVPILIRPCDFRSLKISTNQALPFASGEGLKPISDWSNDPQYPWRSDNAWLNVVKELKNLISDVSSRQ